MINISYPNQAFETRIQKGKDFIFDRLRKKWLLLTPEEWVRQNFLQYIIQVKQYPATLIALEKEIRLGELTKRFDILVYNSEHAPWLMVECKASSVPLTEKVLEQVVRYNISIPVSYMVITNGNHTYGWSRVSGQAELIDELPFHT